MNKFRVIAIPDMYTVIINAGKKDNIILGSRLAISGPNVEIVDPETKKSLGFLNRKKATVVVIDLYNEMCVCENTETTNHSLASNMIPSIATIFGSSVVKSLDVNENQVGIEGYDTGGVISIGDNAELLSRPEETSE